MGHVLFVGEGVTDVGDEGVPRALRLGNGGQTEERRPRGAIPILVLRVLEDSSARSGLQLQTRSVFTRRMHGKGFARKVKAAMVDAVREKASAVVFVSDRGGERNRKRLEEMKNGRNEATADGIDVPTALGLAIEELEAWLLADETVVSDVTGAAVSGALPDPELDPDPKATLSKLWTQAADEAEAWRSYEAIAEKLDIGRLRRRCPRGFEPFHQEVRERLSPLASG